MNSSAVGGVTATAVAVMSNMLPSSTTLCKVEVASSVKEATKDSNRGLIFLDQSEPRCKSLIVRMSLLLASSSNLNDSMTTLSASVETGSLYLGRQGDWCGSQSKQIKSNQIIK